MIAVVLRLSELKINSAVTSGKLFRSCLKIWREKSTATSSFLPAIRNRGADDCQACQVFGLSSYWQECGRKEFVAQQQKRPIFQQRYVADGELVYKHSKRYFYISTYFMISVTVAIVLINAAFYASGYQLTADRIMDEQSKYIFMNMSLLVCPVLYLLTHTLISRTIFYIYYNQSKRQFHGICYSWRMARKNVMFKPGEVQLGPENASALQLLRGSYIINKNYYHIAALDFTSTRYYNLMLGFIKD